MKIVEATDIIAAVRIPVLIKDPFVRDAEFSTYTSGKLEMFGGGLSQVFAIKRDAKKFAFKVWHTKIEKNRERYKIIKDYLVSCGLPYFIEFTYYENGLFVIDQSLDSIRMEWVEGSTLREYINLNIDNAPILKNLADSFSKMVLDLGKYQISHGDLHHENIIVTNNGELKLIDYDSICVPGLEGNVELVRGLRCFQHPMRFVAPSFSSLGIDRFSELVIYLSIVACIENPLLWNKYSIADERLLFCFRDFQEYEDRPIWKELRGLSSQVQKLVKLMESYLAAYIFLPSYTDYE